MFEGIIFGFLIFAVAYVMLMRVMARRADVLHGRFIDQNYTAGAGDLVRPPV